MTISLYNNSSAYNTLYKSMTKLKDVTATIKGACSVDNPTLVIDNPGIAFNYFYIGDFGRYYKVTSRVLSPGQIMLISGVSDPIESFNSGISGLDVFINRAEDLSLRSPELSDSMIPLESDVQIDKVIGDTVIGSGSGMVVIGVI